MSEKFTKKKKLRVDVVKHYRERVANAKEFLPKNWRDLLVERYPDYNSKEGADLLTNVSSGRTTDLRLTEIIEVIAEEFKQKEKTA